MTRLFARFSQKRGLKPGAPVFVGEPRQEHVRITVIDYNKTEITEREIERAEDCFGFRDSSSLTWINISGMHDTKLVEEVATHFGIHPLAIEDILNTGHRPKIEETDSYILVILKMLYPEGEEGEIHSEQVSIVFGKKYVLSFQERDGDVFEPVRTRIRNTTPRVRFLEPDYLAYALTDAVVDGYYHVLEHVAEQVDACEDRMMANDDGDDLETIHQLRRELVLMRRRVWPLREVVTWLERSESPLLSDVTRPYLRDLFDHTIQVIDTIESFRDVVTGLMDFHLSNVSNRMNQVMKVLTIIATIFIPLGFLAGVYGMNFDTDSPFNMPELGFRYGYLLFWLIALLIGVGLFTFFRRRKWL